MKEYILQYYTKGEWTFVSDWDNALVAWVSLGSDNLNYRVVDSNGKIHYINQKLKV